MFDWFKSKKPSIPAQPQTAPNATGVQVIDIGEGLRIHLSPFDISLTQGVASCWVYRSEGLMRLGQKELLYAVLRGDGEPPKDPLYHTQVVGMLAQKGQLVTVGGRSQFGATHPGLFGRRDFRGVGYAHPYNLEKALPPGAEAGEYLAVIALTESETLSSQHFGLARTLARLGQGARFFPYPVWNDVRRPEIIDRSHLETTLLRGFAGVAHIAGAAPLREQGVLRLRLSAADANLLASGLSQARDSNVALLVPTTAGWNQCAACLTWIPGSKEPVAITASWPKDGRSPMNQFGESLLGCFLGFAISSSPGEGIQMIEDGFCLIASAKTMNELILALKDHQRFKVDGSSGMIPFEFIPG